MVNSRVGKNRARVRVLLTFCFCLSLILLALSQFPTKSTARYQPNQQQWRQGKRHEPQFVPGEVLVRYRSESIARNHTGRNVLVARSGELLPLEVERRQGADLVAGLRLVHVAPEDTLKTIAELRTNPDVLYAEPNYIMRAATAPPNDEHYAANRQFALAKIGAPAAWEFTQGSSNVVVAVLDQGIKANHVDLQANMWVNPAPGSVPPVINDINGANFIVDPANGNSIYSGDDHELHATHVAGIIGAKGNNGIGIAGVNWNVKLMSLKFLAVNGFGDTSDAIDACTYAKKMRDLWISSGGTQGANVRVINASFGEIKFASGFLNTLTELNNAGILFVAAAGNIDNGTIEPDNDLVPHFPSSYDVPNVIAVASTNADDHLSSFSHFGATTVDIAAPGAEFETFLDIQGVLSTTPPCSNPGPFPKPCTPAFPSLTPPPTTDTYSYLAGTSMATPFVAGSAALLWAQNPNLTVQQVKNLLILNGDVQATLTDKVLTSRRLNVGNSFAALQDNDVTPPGAVTQLRVNTMNGRTLGLGWTAAGDDGAGGGSAKLYEVAFIDAITNEEIVLRGVLPAAPGTPQTTQVSIPYRHTVGKIRVRAYDNRGNQSDSEVAVAVAATASDPYDVVVGNPAPISTGGDVIDVNGDDIYVDFALPFSFPFFGNNFTEMVLSSNGNIFFSDPPTRDLAPGNPNVADDSPGYPTQMGGYKMIAGLWDDLDLTRSPQRPDAGIYVLHPSATRIIFRWQGVPCNFDGVNCQGLSKPGATPIDFEIELNADGTIKSRYGNSNANLRPTVGLGGQGRDPYVVTSHSSKDTDLSLTSAREVIYVPRGPVSAATLSGPQVEMKNWTFNGHAFVYAKLNFPDSGYRVNDWGMPSQAGNTFTVNAAIDHSNGTNVPTISSNAQIWDLGALSAGNYSFAFKTSGATAKVLNFTVSGTPPPVNPITGTAGAREFVRWQYKDFLRREPDGPGWDHWTGEITICATEAGRFPNETEAQCVERKRANTSAAFFFSPEFSNTGYFVIRVYRGSLGRMPHYGGGTGVDSEFTRDAGIVGTGIVVNDALDHDRINANKRAFVDEFVTRFEFRQIYEGLNNTQYVDKLFETTQVTPTAGERQALIDELNANAPNARASVLFKVVDGTTTVTGGLLVFNTNYGKAFYDNLFNAAFVQMEYFGYLLRDPDPGGYDFWLGKLNHFGNWVDAQMVLSFIESPEYRSRFGAP